MSGGDLLVDAWQRAAAGHDVSVQLAKLVPAVAREIDRRPADLRAIQNRLEALLSFLASQPGRTDTNCRVVERFFEHSEDFGWDADWDHLPGSFQDILADLARALHDTLGAPQVARDLRSTPEQLLERLREIEV